MGDHAAEDFDVSPRSVQRATTVLDQGEPEVIEALAMGEAWVQTSTPPPAVGTRPACRRPPRPPTPDHPDADLIAYEAELEALVVEWQGLDEAWPKRRTPMERWKIGRRHEECPTRIAELHELIAETEAQMLAGAAVQLRRLDAMLDRQDREAVGLLESALKVVEREALSTGF